MKCKKCNINDEGFCEIYQMDVEMAEGICDEDIFLDPPLDMDEDELARLYFKSNSYLEGF